MSTNSQNNLFSPNRVAVYLTAIAGLATALVPAVEGVDTTTAATTIAGFAGIVAVAYKWLEGWQRKEAREAAIAHPHLANGGAIVNNYPQLPAGTAAPRREAPPRNANPVGMLNPPSQAANDEGDLDSPSAADLLDGAFLDDPSDIPFDLGNIGHVGAAG